MLRVFFIFLTAALCWSCRGEPAGTGADGGDGSASLNGCDHGDSSCPGDAGLDGMSVGFNPSDSSVDARARSGDAAMTDSQASDLGEDALSDMEPMGADASLEREADDAGAVDSGAEQALPLCSNDAGNGEVSRDIAYSDASERTVLDLYRTASPGPNPLLIWVHGGGWRGGTKDNVNRVFLSFRQRGYSVASIEYRLSDTPWPTTVRDVKSAVRFLRARADAFELDPDRFVAMGSSAGGHLVALLGTSPDVAIFRGGAPEFQDVSDAVQAVVNFFGPTDLDEMDNDAVENGCPADALCHDCAGSPESLLIDCRPSVCGDLADEASPVDYVDGDEAPFLTFHGSRDCTVPTPQGRRLHDAIIAAGRVSQLVEVPGAGHSVNECLTPANIQLMTALVEREIRGCRLEDSGEVERPEDSMIGACLWQSCPDLAAACDATPACVALEVCFQDCFARSLGNCIRRCLGEVDDSARGRVTHEPLFRCGQSAGCYPR